MKKSTLFLSALTIALLQACGGGGDDNGGGGGGVGPSPTPPAPSTPVNQGSVSALFSLAEARFWMFGNNSESLGVPDQLTQSGGGAMIVVDDYRLTGAAATWDIAGNASFALGRWVGGTVAGPSVTAEASTENTYHYLVYNVPGAFPTSGSYTCTVDASTAPTSGTNAGSVGGQATLSFDGAGAHASGSLNVSVGGQGGTVDIPNSIRTPSSQATSGAFFAQGAGAVAQVADTGGGYALVVGYKAQVGGAIYRGVAHLACRQ